MSRVRNAQTTERIILNKLMANKTPSDEQKLLRGLSQMSLAQEYTAWERERRRRPRAELLYNRIRRASSAAAPAQPMGPKCSGRISRFVRDQKYPQTDQNVRKAIQRGTIQMAFRSFLLADFLRDHRHQIAIPGIVALV